MLDTLEFKTQYVFDLAHIDLEAGMWLISKSIEATHHAGLIYAQHWTVGGVYSRAGGRDRRYWSRSLECCVDADRKLTRGSIFNRREHIAVNVSARQFHDRDFVADVLAILERTGANPQ